jgi:DNA-binding Lrp family transcriptional regulator
MVQAYILIQTRPGTGPAVTREVSRVKGVDSAGEVTGPYDIIARAEARTLEELSKQVLGSIEALTGVIRTITCSVIHL